MEISGRPIYLGSQRTVAAHKVNTNLGLAAQLLV